MNSPIGGVTLAIIGLALAAMQWSSSGFNVLTALYVGLVIVGAMMALRKGPEASDCESGGRANSMPS